jgi:hypothetical protein
MEALRTSGAVGTGIGRRLAAACLAAAIMVGSVSGAAAAQGDAHPLRSIDRAGLCVTNGVVSASPGGKLAVETPSARATVRDTDGATDQIAEIRFRYLGPSRESRRLASGQLRRQIGLKLRAEDGCNLIYAMWRIAPEAGVVVSIKRNPGLHTHKQCGARGYVDLKPQGGSGRDPVRPGESHVLRAELRGQVLTIATDGKVAWRGTLAPGTALPVGPPGLRTDNGRFIFEYFTPEAAVARPTRKRVSPGQGRCRITAED